MQNKQTNNRQRICWNTYLDQFFMKSLVKLLMNKLLKKRNLNNQVYGKKVNNFLKCITMILIFSMKIIIFSKVFFKMKKVLQLSETNFQQT